MSTSSSGKIGLLMATVVGMNAMIGAGIFVIPTALAGQAGPASILTFLLVSASIWCMAQSMARLAQLYPEEGSFYTYTRQWGGHKMGLFAAALYLLGLIIAMGLLTQAAGLHLVRYLPMFCAQDLGIFCLATFTLLNMFGASLSSIGQQILIVLTVFPLIATTVMCLSKASLANLKPFAPNGFSIVFEQTRLVAFAFFGFEATTSLFNVIRDPQKNLPRAITYSLLAVAGLYLLFVVSLILAVPLETFQAYPGPISGALSHLFPHTEWLVEGIHISSLIAIVGTIHSMIWASGFLLLSLVKKMRCCSTRNLVASEYVTQKTCTLFISIAIFISFIILTNNMFFNFTAMFLISAFLLSMFQLLTLQSEWKSGQNIITVLGIFAACFIFYFAQQNCRDYFAKKSAVSTRFSDHSQN